jgi:TPR repeat protein
MLLHNGEGISKNVHLAAKYYKLSADQGNADAQYAYGLLLKNGEGVSKNVLEARRSLTLAADQGNTAARTELRAL